MPSGAAVTIGSAMYLWCSYTLINDHFGRITPARQILVFGDTPFRDFLDPGFFLTLYSSAFMQWLLGHNLLGEVLLNVSCMAVGYAFAFRLASQASGSQIAGMLAVVATLVVTPRAYDYDKVLFYPWGMYACWRYAERPTRTSLAHVAMVMVLGGLFRYDTGVYVGAAALVGVAVRHRSEWRVLAARLVLLLGLATALAVPVLVFLQLNGGVTAAIDQVVTYAQREGARTQLFQLTPLRLESATPAKQLLDDPMAAATILSYVALALPVVALLAALLRRQGFTAADWSKRWSAIVLVGLATLFILRNPILARIGAVMPVIGVLAAVVVGDVFRRQPQIAGASFSIIRAAYHAGVAVLAIAVILPLVVASAVLYRRPAVGYLSRWRVTELARTPPTTGLAPRYAPLVAYVRACTTETDRVLATWFVPELFFYSGRAFAGGLPVMFGGHWSEDRFQRQIVRLLSEQTVPLVVMRFIPEQIDIEQVREVWPAVGDYVTREYTIAATTDFGTGDLTYQIWSRRGISPTSRYGPAALPCFGIPRHAAAR